MGIRGAHKLTDHIDRIDSSQLIIILNCLYQQKKDNGQLGSNPRTSPVIDLDASWIVRKLTCSNDARMGYLVRLSKILLRLGCDVVVICDGPLRHHSKRAKTQRDAQSKQNIIDYKALSIQLMTTVNSIEHTNDYNEKKSLLEKKVVINNKLEKLRKKLYSNIFDVGDSFYDSLCIEANEINTSIEVTNKITIIQNKFQADSLLAFRCMNNLSDICFASDTDQAALCGEKCVSVREFSITKNNQSLNKISLFSSCINTIYKIANYIRLPHNHANVVKAAFPVFQGISEIRCRALIAIGLGCDVYDLPIISPAKMNEFLISKQEIQSSDLFNELLEHLISKRILKNKETDNQIVRNKYNEMLQILVDTYVYEPIIMTKCSDVGIVLLDFEYISYPIPIHFHYYIKDFYFDESDYENRQVETVSDSMKQCVGPGVGTHLFLLGEGYTECELCSRFLCVYCRFEFEEHKYCVDCYQTKQGIADDVDPISAEDMLAELAEHGMQLNTTDPIETIVGLYNSTINNNLNVVYDRDGLENRIKYPIETSNYLDNLPLITTFDFDNGGIFLNDNRLSDINRVELMQLFSELLIVGKSRNEIYDDDTYNLLPDIIVNFAEQSRVHSGYRLLKRALRHALDFETFNINSGLGSVVSYKQTTGLMVQQKVKASMRANIYETQVLFTKDELVACSCTCQSGSQNNQRVVCVHILPIIYKITLLLYRGLSDHMLVEFREYYNSCEILTLDIRQLFILQEAILILKKSTIKYSLDDDNKDIGSLLSSFTVGTELSKRIRLTGNPTTMIPFNSMDHRSLRKKIKDRLIVVDHEEQERVDQQVIDEFQLEEEIEEFDEMTKRTYISIMKLTSAFFFTIKQHDPSFDDDFMNENIGYRVMGSRGEVSFEMIKSPGPEVKKQIKELIKLANASERSRQRNNLPNNNNNADDSNSETEDSVDSSSVDASSDEEELDNENETLVPRQLFEQSNENKIRSEDKDYHTCCVCGKTSSKYTQLIFRKLPITTQKDLPNNASNQRRFTHAKRTFREQLYFHRWKISKKGSVKRLKYCNEHEEEEEYLPVKYKNQIGKSEIEFAWILVPKDPSKESSRTRTDSLQRKSFERPTKEKVIKQSTRAKRNQPFHYKCDFVGCLNRANQNNIIIMRVPPERKMLSDKQKKRNLPRLTFASANLFRKLVLQKMGRTRDKNKSLRICNQHPIQEVEKEVVWTNTQEQQMKTKIKMNLPFDIGRNSSLNDAIVTDRQLAKENRCNDVFKSTTQQICDSGLLFSAEQRKLLSQSLNCFMNMSQTNEPNTPVSHRISFERRKYKQELKPTYQTWSETTNKYMKMSTGFPTKASFIAFLCVLCNGEIEAINKRVSTLTWYEEWLSYFQITWCKHVMRWQDAEYQFKTCAKTLRHVFDTKLAIHKKIRRKWPIFVTYQEDAILRKQHWNDEYRGRRLVMWDNTNVRMYQPTDGDNQRKTYSAYYGGNVAKGAVFIQPCGWSGTHDLFPGAISDTNYMIKSGAIKLHDKYLQKYDSDNKEIKFHILMDKGYRITYQAHEEGGQMVIQPNFAKSDERFSAFQTMRSAAVATDRSGNERAVKYMKHCEYISSGLKAGEDSRRLADVWLCWGFQQNFLYKPVL